MLICGIIIVVTFNFIFHTVEVNNMFETTSNVLNLSSIISEFRAAGKSDDDIVFYLLSLQEFDPLKGSLSHLYEVLKHIK